MWVRVPSRVCTWDRCSCAGAASIGMQRWRATLCVMGRGGLQAPHAAAHSARQAPTMCRPVGPAPRVQGRGVWTWWLGVYVGSVGGGRPHGHGCWFQSCTFAALHTCIWGRRCARTWAHACHTASPESCMSLSDQVQAADQLKIVHIDASLLHKLCVRSSCGLMDKAPPS